MTPFDPPLPDGIYLDLSALRYFRQETRGSSDWSLLHRQGHGFWWRSRYNPHYHPPETEPKALAFGHALHTIVLEGVDAYEARYVVEPHKGHYRNLAITVEDMRVALRDNGFSTVPGWWKAPDFAKACRINIPQVPCWPNIMADFTEALGDPALPGSRFAITLEEDFHLRFMREMAVGDFPGNDAIRKLLLDEAPPLVEVTVIATVDGIRRRWRFDRMFPRLDVDLKSLQNWSGQPLSYAAGDAIARRRYAIQRADYWIGRQNAYRMIAERGAGAIHGGSPEQRKHLLSWPEDHPHWDWSWIIYQKPTSAGVPPILMPVWEDSFDPRTGHPSFLRQLGEHQLEEAIAFYRAMVMQFGFDKPWGRVEPLHYTEPGPGRQHLISYPDWIGKDFPDESAAYG